jgi:hypothetical protein
MTRFAMNAGDALPGIARWDSSRTRAGVSHQFAHGRNQAFRSGQIGPRGVVGSGKPTVRIDVYAQLTTGN